MPKFFAHLPAVLVLLALFCFGTAHAEPEPEREFAHEDAVIEAALDNYLIDFPESYEEAIAVLEEILRSQSADTPVVSRVRTLTYYGIDLWYADRAEEGWQVLSDALAIAEESGVTDAIAEARAGIVSLHVDEWNVQEALVELEKLERIAGGIQSPRIQYFVHNLAGRVLQSVSDHEGALGHFLNAAEAVRKTQPELQGGRRQLLNGAIAYLQSELRNYETSLAYADIAIELSIQEGFYYGLGDLYLLKGFLHGELEQIEEGIQAHEEAIKWARENEQHEVVLLSLNNIGSTYIQLKDYEKAREILNEALTEAIARESVVTEQLLRFNLAYVEVFSGSYDRGIEALEAATERLRADYTAPQYADLLGYVAEAYIEAELWQKAVVALTEQRALNEKIAQSQREEALNELQTRYQANEQAVQIELLEQANELQNQVIENSALQQRIYVLFAVVVVLGSILLLILLRLAYKSNLRLKDVNRKLKHQSSHDPLTEVLNRRSFQDAMRTREQHYEQVQQQQHPDAILLLDIDFFKQINDQHGHAAGDLVLVELAKRLKRISRTSDMVIRWGGEEFLIYLKEMNPENLAQYTERVLEVIAERPVKVADSELQVSATAGFISLPFDSVSEQELDWERCLQIADMALYIGKVHGRNQGLGVMGLNVPFEEAQQALAKDLAGAIERGWVRTVNVRGPELND